MRRSTVGHCFSLGFGLAAALISLVVGKSDQLGVAAYAAEGTTAPLRGTGLRPWPY